MRKIGRAELDHLLKENVCEIVFVRRRPERAPGRSVVRRMLCCNSIDLLNSENGIRSLNFRFPKGPKQIDEAYHNVVVVWDMLLQDYRNVSMDACFLVKTIPADDSFWEYFNTYIYPMSEEQKLAFIENE